MRRREATKAQRRMILLMAAAWASLFLWLIPEVSGVISPESEDTYSEWVWDLSGWAVLGIVLLHLVAGVLFIWSAGHFVEGWIRRR